MGSFGENLRREREMRGVTLQEISAATKISVRFLKSIESEEFSRLPGGIFRRSFVRAYARYLGLDEESLVAEFLQAARATDDVDLTKFSPSKTFSYSIPRRRSYGTLVGVIVAVVLLAAGYGLWRHSRRPATPPQPAAQQALPSATSQSSPSATAAKSSTNPAGGKAQPARAPANHGVLSAAGGAASSVPKLPPVTLTDGKLVLQVATTERSWVAIDADGRMIKQGIMNPNEVKTYEANASFDVLPGNALGVILSLNGKTLKPLGRQGEVKKVHLTWDSLKQLNPQ
ncbi:MAG: DUF4115 domain-containing protein [Acidobacteriota bacterium]